MRLFSFTFIARMFRRLQGQLLWRQVQGFCKIGLSLDLFFLVPAKSNYALRSLTQDFEHLNWLLDFISFRQESSLQLVSVAGTRHKLVMSIVNDLFGRIVVALTMIRVDPLWQGRFVFDQTSLKVSLNERCGFSRRHIFWRNWLFIVSAFFDQVFFEVNRSRRLNSAFYSINGAFWVCPIHLTRLNFGD